MRGHFCNRVLLNIDPLNTWVAAVPAFLTYGELLCAQNCGSHCFIQAAPTLYEFDDLFGNSSDMDEVDDITAEESSDDDVDDFDITVLQRGITQFHTGAELDVYFRATDWLTINGFISGGSWYYKGEAEVSVYNADTSAQIGETTNVDRDGIKVSTAPQFTTGIGFDAKIVEGLSIDARIKYNDNHYEFTDVNTSKEDFKGLQLDSYALTNAGLTYRFNVGDNNMTFRANVFNVFDKIAINQSDRFGYFITGGRTFNASMRYEF